jgi:hypothetical protein
MEWLQLSDSTFIPLGTVSLGAVLMERCILLIGQNTNDCDSLHFLIHRDIGH